MTNKKLPSQLVFVAKICRAGRNKGQEQGKCTGKAWGRKRKRQERRRRARKKRGRSRKRKRKSQERNRMSEEKKRKPREGT
jgi:hypothetical protein